MKTYLGDGVYIEFDGFHYILFVNHPDNAAVFLEYEVAQRLINYIQENESQGDNLLIPDP